MTLAGARSEVARRADRDSHTDHHAYECTERTKHVSSSDTTSDGPTNSLTWGAPVAVCWGAGVVAGLPQRLRIGYSHVISPLLPLQLG